jgi:1-deoxy-D-xylulose-5-phosphate reductoisomerase
MILYNTDMKIPISNTLYENRNNFFKTSDIEIKQLNNLNFQKVNLKNFPSIKLLDKCFTSGISTPIVINAANEVLVDLFLNEKIEFLDIVKIINKILKSKDFKKYAKRNPNSVKGIKMIDNWARLKTVNMCVI